MNILWCPFLIGIVHFCLQLKDNFSIMDKVFCPVMSIIQRLYCTATLKATVCEGIVPLCIGPWKPSFGGGSCKLFSLDYCPTCGYVCLVLCSSPETEGMGMKLVTICQCCRGCMGLTRLGEWLELSYGYGLHSVVWALQTSVGALKLSEVHCTCSVTTLHFAEFAKLLYLLFTTALENGGGGDGVWLLDLSFSWHYLCPSLADYLRLAVVHLGLFQWPYLFTPYGLSMQYEVSS